MPARTDPIALVVERARDADLTIYSGATQRGTPWAVAETDARVGLALLEPCSVACVVTSPPYYWQRDYGMAGQLGHEPTPEAYVAALVEVFRDLRPKLARSGTLFLNLGDTYYSAKGRPHGCDGKQRGRQFARRTLRAVDGPGLGVPRKSLLGIPWRVALAMQADGWTWRSAITWQRPGAQPEPTARDRPWRTSEVVLLFTVGPRYHFDRSGLGGEEDVWTIPAPGHGCHGTAPFPLALAERCLACGCPSGCLVLDPFAGSGTTLLAAIGRNSPAVGIDLSPACCRAAAEALARGRG
jgi:DNA modification methylase